MKAIQIALAACIYTLAAAAWIGGIAAFLWSVFLAYLAKGLIGAAAMILLPFLGQLVLAWMCWPSDYSTLVVAVLGVTAFLSVLSVAAESLTTS